MKKPFLVIGHVIDGKLHFANLERINFRSRIAFDHTDATHAQTIKFPLSFVEDASTLKIYMDMVESYVLREGYTMETAQISIYRITPQSYNVYHCEKTSIA